MNIFKLFIAIFCFVTVSGYNSNANSPKTMPNTIESLQVQQNGLLQEYESKLKVADDRLSTLKKKITSEQLKNLDVKMKLGEIENKHNSISSKIKELKKSKSKNSQIEFDFLNKEFEQLDGLFQQMDVLLK